MVPTLLLAKTAFAQTNISFQYPRRIVAMPSVLRALVSKYADGTWDTRSASKRHTTRVLFGMSLTAGKEKGHDFSHTRTAEQARILVSTETTLSKTAFFTRAPFV